MNTKTLAGTLLAGMLGATLSTQAADDGPDRGRIFSASGTIATGTSSAVLIELPRGVSFLMTQYCQSQGLFGPVAAGSAFGAVPVQDYCTTYTPGVMFEGGQTLSCTQLFGPVFDNVQCMATGFLKR